MLLASVSLRALLFTLELPNTLNQFVYLDQCVLVVILELLVELEEFGAFIRFPIVLLLPYCLVLSVFRHRLVPLSAGSFELTGHVSDLLMQLADDSVFLRGLIL